MGCHHVLEMSGLRRAFRASMTGRGNLVLVRSHENKDRGVGEAGVSIAADDFNGGLARCLQQLIE
jgi:hypothetical protein